MMTAQWDADFFDPFRNSNARSSNDCDMIFRKDEPLYAPAMFCRKDLPKILMCIAAEVRELEREPDPVNRQRMPGSSVADTSQLGRWYESILSNVFTGTTADDPPGPNGFGDSTLSFSMPAVQSFVPSESAYQYVSLMLPPLWQHERNRSLQSQTSVHPVPRQPHVFREPMLCLFRYVKSTGLWYACLRIKTQEKRILRRALSPKDSDWIRFGRNRGDLT